jgi:hypothetical protein
MREKTTGFNQWMNRARFFNYLQPSMARMMRRLCRSLTLHRDQCRVQRRQNPYVGVHNRSAKAKIRRSAIVVHGISVGYGLSGIPNTGETSEPARRRRTSTSVDRNAMMMEEAIRTCPVVVHMKASQPYHNNYYYQSKCYRSKEHHL